VLALFDRSRQALLRAMARTPLATFVTRRTPRIGARAAIAIVFALALASTFPALALAIGPLALGIPHVAASLRYLIVRREVSRPFIAAIVVTSIVIVAARVLASSLGAGAARIEIAAGTALFAMAAIEAARRSRRWTRGLGALAILGVGLALAVQAPFFVRLAFVHVHNLGVVALWVLMFRREGSLPKLVGGALVVSLLLVASGATIPLARALGGLDAGGVDCHDVAAWLAPSILPSLALPLVVMHAFTDSVHYAFWLGVVPEEELRGEGTLTFRMTARGLALDFGALALGALAIAFAVILVLAFTHGAFARDAYFVVAGFHGYVEGAVLVWVLVGGVPDRRRIAADRDRVAVSHARVLPKPV
jgi:hypothetical protein